MNLHSPLARRIHDLLLTDPEKQWSYDEICFLLGAVNKTVSSRCMDLLRAGKLVKEMVPSGRPRGRCVRVSIKPSIPVFPSWLLPAPSSDSLRSQTTQSHRHENFEKRRKVLR